MGTFVNVCMWKFDTDMKLPCIVFVGCLLKVLSIMRFWMVTIILDLSVTFWKLSNKITKCDLKHLEILKSLFGRLLPLIDKFR